MPPICAVLRAATVLAVAMVLTQSAAWARGRPMSAAEKQEMEQRQIAQAELACKAGNEKGFFHALIQSAAARARFTAHVVDFIESDGRGEARSFKIAGAHYDRFPIRMVDYDWKATSPVKPGDNDEYIVMAFRKSEQNRISVEWTRVHYRGAGDGDGRGNPYDLDGKPYNPARPGHGRIVLLPKEGCWEIAADIRNLKR